MIHPTVARLLVILCLASLLAGCASEPKPDNTKLYQSKVLVKPLSVVLAQALIAKKKAGEELPEDYQSVDFAVSVIESIRLQHPEVFMVTEAQEKAFFNGKFDDRYNAKRVSQLIDQVTELHVPLDTINSYLVSEYLNDKLHGVRLELAARLLAAQVKTAKMNTTGAN
ncbi:MAG: hypothetical protein GC162_16990 [Planctomycetes bacterium]|nr:hypothetical protein [Planctomycetota bacterium]